MAKDTFVHGKYIVSVDAKQNEYGVWYSEFTVVKDGAAVPVHLSEATPREWTTETEAIWSGIDQGRAFVNLHNQSASD